jgi:hypothetical protein
MANGGRFVATTSEILTATAIISFVILLKSLNVGCDVHNRR